ncbi:hypothetical protein [Marinivivus vitaminiproducens]|uniref:hypothetical protein n=1 Tax=Marinivivus vitaminiproducens TaxID=3035935 RepID=UPI0027A1EDEE|nr:hypothetical protein P4R82_24780 [Geminicoccaceae bacterium SCSIO 64248]
MSRHLLWLPPVVFVLLGFGLRHTDTLDPLILFLMLLVAGFHVGWMWGRYTDAPWPPPKLFGNGRADDDCGKPKV